MNCAVWLLVVFQGRKCLFLPKLLIYTLQVNTKRVRPLEYNVCSFGLCVYCIQLVMCLL